MENVYQQFFFLKYSGGWSFAEAYNLPVGLRVWFVQRLSQQLQDEAEAMQAATSQSSPGTALTAENAPPMPPHLEAQLGKTE